MAILPNKTICMTTVNVYLNFDGHCEEAFLHYRSVFGGEFSYMGRFRDMPADAGASVPPEEADRIMHVSLPVGGDTVLMGSDTGGEWAPSWKAGNNFSISVNTDSRQEADRIFGGLSRGGEVTMPLGPTFWGDYFGMCTDRFGVNWMVSFNEQNKE